MTTDETSERLDELDPAERYRRESLQWLNTVYQGDKVRQLSVRSIVAGMLIGGVMSVSNLYVGLKTGWGLGVTVTSCIIAYAVFKSLEAVIPRFRRDPFTILENYTMSSAASAAGYMATSGLVSAIPALYLTTKTELGAWQMMAWLSAVSVLGVFMAIPLKRQLINIDKLPFPSGIATAETLKSMHTVGVESLRKARSLFAAGLLGSVVAFYRDGWKSIPSEFPLLPTQPARNLLERQTIGFEGSLIMVAAGAIMGIRVGLSLLLGAIIYYGIIGNELLERGIVQPGYKGIVSWTLWPATALLVTSGLLAFAMRWRTVLRALQGMATLFSAEPKEGDPLEAVEVPGSWFVGGTMAAGFACIVLGQFLFGISWWMGLLAVLMTFLLSIVAARATGETDITPLSAMGKITQLMYGVIAPSNMTTNLMTAMITGGAAAHSADLLTDLKSGYLLGGNPRKQTISQLFGVLAGSLVCVPAYTIIAQPDQLGSAEMPAPAAQVWAGVAKMLARGPDALPPGALEAMVYGGVLGLIITLAEEFAPVRFRKWIPSATGLGIAGVIPAFNSVSMFLGAFAAWSLLKLSAKTDETYTIPVSSGLIAGESLMGVAVILWTHVPEMLEKLVIFNYSQ